MIVNKRNKKKKEERIKEKKRETKSDPFGVIYITFFKAQCVLLACLFLSSFFSCLPWCFPTSLDASCEMQESPQARNKEDVYEVFYSERHQHKPYSVFFSYLRLCLKATSLRIFFFSEAFKTCIAKYFNISTWCFLLLFSFFYPKGWWSLTIVEARLKRPEVALCKTFLANLNFTSAFEK